MIYAGFADGWSGPIKSFFSSAYSTFFGKMSLQARRALANAIINSGSAIGMGIGLIGSSVLVKSMSMGSANVLFLCCRWLVCDAVRFTLVIIPWQGKSETTCVRSESADGNDDWKRRIRRCFSGLLVRSVYFLYFCNCYGYCPIVTPLPSYLQTERGFDGGAIEASALVAVVVSPAHCSFSHLSDKVSQQQSQSYS